MAFPPSSKQLPHIAAFFLFSLTVSTLAQAPPASCGECASTSAVWCTNLPYPRFIGTQGRCLPLGQNYTNCTGFQFYVPPGFKNCEYVLRTADAPLPFAIEEWYHPLHFFGACSDWRESAMTLIADYTYSISLRGCKLHQPFMFVPVLFGGNESLCPKLGCKNWKQGKVGLGAVSLSGAALQPGGGSGFLPASGDYNMTLYTNHSDPDLRFSVKFDISGVKPSIVVSGPKSVTNATSFPVVITASHPTIFNSSCVVVTCASPSSSCQWTPISSPSPPPATTSFTINVTVSNRSPSPPSSFIITIRVTSSCMLTSESLPVEVSENSWWEVWHTQNLMTGTFAKASPTTLRDLSGTTPGAPLGGWYVTPLHAVSLPMQKKMLLTGWLRSDGEVCRGGLSPGGRRAKGITWITSSLTAPVPSVSVVDERPLYAWQPTNEVASAPHLLFQNYVINGDAMYCSGHTTLADGRLFYTGGARYSDISSPWEMEWGLEYARIFDGNEGPQGTFRQVPTFMPLGRSWYPTASLLADGRVMVTGAYSDHHTDTCYESTCLNPQINIFDPSTPDLFKNTSNPWFVFIDQSVHDIASLINPGIREYTRVFTLPQPILAGKFMRHVLLFGKAGKIVLASLTPGVPMADRLYVPPHASRPEANCGKDFSDQSTAVPLLDGSNGRMLMMGGCVGAQSDRYHKIDVYDVGTDSWSTHETGIRRGVPASLLLPDGTILLISGENELIDQFASANSDAMSDPRYIQIFDPETSTIATETQRLDTFRGYHNMAALNDDGSVIFGGGFNSKGDVGCEEANVQVYYPHYFSKGPPPIINTTTLNLTTGAWVLAAGSTNNILLHGGDVPLHPTKRMALLASNAFTHSYDENQRYVALESSQPSPNSLAFSIPDVPRLIPGIYRLFLLSSSGVPSRAIPVRITSSFSYAPSPSVSPSAPSNQASAFWTPLNIGLITSAIIVTVVAIIFMVYRYRKTIAVPTTRSSRRASFTKLNSAREAPDHTAHSRADNGDTTSAKAVLLRSL